MKIRHAIAVAALGSVLSFPMAIAAQNTGEQRHDDHQQAKAEQKASDHGTIRARRLWAARRLAAR